MSRASEREALAAYRDWVAGQLAPFTREPIVVSRPTGDPQYLLTFPQRARLAPDLFLVVRHYFTVSGGSADTTGYHYALENADRREIIVYHWHPSSQFGSPHLHLRSGGLAGGAI